MGTVPMLLLETEDNLVGRSKDDPIAATVSVESTNEGGGDCKINHGDDKGGVDAKKEEKIGGDATSNGRSMKERRMKRLERSLILQSQAGAARRMERVFRWQLLSTGRGLFPTGGLNNAVKSRAGGSNDGAAPP